MPLFFGSYSFKSFFNPNDIFHHLVNPISNSGNFVRKGEKLPLPLQAHLPMILSLTLTFVCHRIAPVTEVHRDSDRLLICSCQLPINNNRALLMGGRSKCAHIFPPVGGCRLICTFDSTGVYEVYSARGGYRQGQPIFFRELSRIWTSLLLDDEWDGGGRNNHRGLLNTTFLYDNRM